MDFQKKKNEYTWIDVFYLSLSDRRPYELERILKRAQFFIKILDAIRISEILRYFTCNGDTEPRCGFDFRVHKLSSNNSPGLMSTVSYGGENLHKVDFGKGLITSCGGLKVSSYRGLKALDSKKMVYYPETLIQWKIYSVTPHIFESYNYVIDIFSKLEYITPISERDRFEYDGVLKIMKILTIYPTPARPLKTQASEKTLHLNFLFVKSKCKKKFNNISYLDLPVELHNIVFKKLGDAVFAYKKNESKHFRYIESVFRKT